MGSDIYVLLKSLISTVTTFLWPLRENMGTHNNDNYLELLDPASSKWVNNERTYLHIFIVWNNDVIGFVVIVVIEKNKIENWDSNRLGS